MTDDQAEIKEYVRQRYGERARQASQLKVLNVKEAACCADGTCETDMDDSLGSFSNLYVQGELEGLPVEAVAASAGCGNPTALAGLKAGECVLDLGSGGGIDCFLAARQVGPKGHVIGLDMTPDMLALARRNAKTLGISNVEFVEGYIEDIPLPEASVDVVISNCVVCLSPDKEAVAREAFRVLSPGGRLHLSDIMALGPMPQGMRDDPQKWASCVSGAEERETYLGRLSEAGFRDIDITEEGGPRSQEGRLPDVTSVKVIAYKPA
ncbi:MAG: arsenite methyltransferase [Dehalococcoidia bacterium]|nr:arsenite methyltransferase [Dehalococcoidia bacterium]